MKRRRHFGLQASICLRSLPCKILKLTAFSQMENHFPLMDVVWARARKPKSEIFWPAQVIETTSIPRRSTKKIVASVRFLGENTEEDVKNPKDIKKWDCEEQNAFIEKGRNSLKGSNTKISFNKGIKEARKLFKEIPNVSTEGECTHSMDVDKLDNCKSNGTGKSSTSKKITFIDDQAVACSVNDKTPTSTSTQSEKTHNEQNGIEKKKQTPRKRPKKRKAIEDKECLTEQNNKTCSEYNVENKIQIPQKRYTKSNTKQCEINGSDNNQESVYKDNSKEQLYSTRKSPRKSISSNPSKNLCNDKISVAQSFEQKAALRRSPRKAAEQEPEIKTQPENKKSKQNHTKISEKKTTTETSSESEKTKCKQHQKKRKREVFEKKEDILAILCEDLPEPNLKKNESKSLDNSSTHSNQIENSTKPKGRKRLFTKQEKISTSSSVSSDKETEVENNRNTCEVDTRSNNKDESDSDESSDQELMETALSPNSKKFESNDVVWAKVNRGAYWPAQVKRVQKKPKKIYVKFLGCNEKRSFSCTKLYPFACDADQRKELIREASLEDPSYFQSAFTEAEDLVRKKALGISIEPDDDDDEDIELVDSEEPNDPKETQQPSQQVEIPVDETDVRRSKRSKKQISKYNRDILSYIREAKPILKEILEEKRPCERHTIFTTGKSKAKNALKHQSGFGPISDPDLENGIVELLMAFHNELSSKKHDYSRSTYVIDVWLPEAIIYAIQKIDHVDRKDAELVYQKGTSQACDFSHEELVQQLKAKPLTDEEREASVQRAERALLK